MNNGLYLNEQELLQICENYVFNKTKNEQSDFPKGKIKMKIHKYELKSISENPMGFLGVHQYLILNMAYRSIHGENYKEETIRLFVKSAPRQNISHMKYLKEIHVFRKEILCYSEILPKLEQIFSKTPITAKCFYANNDVIILEDLTQIDFKMAAKRDGLLDYNHIECVIKTLAKLHASSLIYELQRNQCLQTSYKEALNENAYPKNACNETHVRYQNVDQAIKVIQAFVKHMSKYEKYIPIILKKIPEKIWKIYEFVQTSKKYQNVFSHGDLWSNNIMFQYDNDDEHKPLQCRFVDFQLARYAPPIIDLLTALTIPTTRKFRQQYLEKFLQQYYGELKTLLKLKNLHINDIITEAEFYKSFEEFRTCGLIESILFSHLTILPEELANNLTSTSDGFNNFFKSQRIEICLKAFHNDHIYRERLTDMLEDLIDNFILINYK